MLEQKQRQFWNLNEILNKVAETDFCLIFLMTVDGIYRGFLYGKILNFLTFDLE